MFFLFGAYNCNRVEARDRTTDPDIVMPERYQSSQRVNSLARVVIAPVRRTYTRLHNYFFHLKLEIAVLREKYILFLHLKLGIASVNYSFTWKIHFVLHLKLEIALAIQASNEGKNIYLRLRETLVNCPPVYYYRIEKVSNRFIWVTTLTAMLDIYNSA